MSADIHAALPLRLYQLFQSHDYCVTCAGILPRRIPRHGKSLVCASCRPKGRTSYRKPLPAGVGISLRSSQSAADWGAA